LDVRNTVAGPHIEHPSFTCMGDDGEVSNYILDVRNTVAGPRIEHWPGCSYTGMSYWLQQKLLPFESSSLCCTE